MTDLKFEAPRGLRLHRYFCGVTLTKATEGNLWWNFERKKWEPYDDGVGCYRGTHAPCRTLRAFKRMLRKHPAIQGKCVLVNRYRNFNIHG